jgi:hypothetical protein
LLFIQSQPVNDVLAPTQFGRLRQLAQLGVLGIGEGEGTSWFYREGAEETAALLGAG